MMFRLEQMKLEHIPGIIELQYLAFPAPFDPDLLWRPEHIQRHLELFPEGQFVAMQDEYVIGSCSNTLISEENFQAHLNWEETVGGYELSTFDPNGTTLYGLDISVHPAYRRIGIGRAFYRERKKLVSSKKLKRFGTACRMPDYKSVSSRFTVHEYAKSVSERQLTDRSLTPLLRYDVTYLGVIENYMDDAESGNSGALLEWAA